MTLDPVTRCSKCNVINEQDICWHCRPLSLDEGVRIAEEIAADRTEMHAFALSSGNFLHPSDRAVIARILLAVLPVVRAAEVSADYASKYGKPPGDWACAECVPHSDMLIEGFRCAHHGLLHAVATVRKALEETK